MWRRWSFDGWGLRSSGGIHGARWEDPGITTDGCPIICLVWHPVYPLGVVNSWCRPNTGPRIKHLLHMVTRYALLSLFLLGGILAQAQDYCTPVFTNGCFNWRSMNISLAGVDWVSTGACTEFDHTATVMTVGAGEATPMVVENGVWCGVSVYVDLNNNYTFDPEELLFNEYNGNQPSRVHEFQITVPLSTPSGQYRMRVLNHWGSDGVSSMNGTGPCGPYEYGNYDEFTLQVVGAASINGHNAAEFRLSPNPTTGIFRVENAGSYERITITSMDGRIVRDQGNAGQAKTIVMDLSNEAAGVYTVRTGSARGAQVLRLVKE